ncbi:hypothetical protein [Calidifontibacter terrae]
MGTETSFAAATTAADPGLPHPDLTDVADPESSMMDTLSILLGQANDPADLLTLAKCLLQEAAATIAADACPTDRPTGIPRTTRQVWALESLIRETEQITWIAQATQAHALARYAATGQETVNNDLGWRARVEYPIGHHNDDADLDIAPVCGWSTRSAAGRLADGLDLVIKTPILHRLATGARVATWRARAVATELCNTTPEVAARIEAQILASRGWDTWSLGKLQRTTRALVQQWEPAAAKKTRQDSERQATNVAVQDSVMFPGLAEMIITGPKEELATLFRAINELAHHRHAAGDRIDTGTFRFDPDNPDQEQLLMGQQRFRAFRDLITANTTVSYELILQIPVVPTPRGAPATAGAATFVGHGTASPAGQAGPTASPGAARGPDNPTDIGTDGDTEITNATTTDVGTEITNATTTETGFEPETETGSNPERGSAPESAPESDPATGSEPASETGSAPEPAYRVGWGRLPGVGLIDPDVTLAMLNAFGWNITRAALDAKTGVTIETAKAGYTPSTRMRDYLQQRDGTCRAAGCERPIDKCDLDHVTPWPTGTTATDNLAGLCRRNHGSKTRNRWTYTLSNDGTCHWTSPTGRTFTTYPASATDDQAS